MGSTTVRIRVRDRWLVALAVLGLLLAGVATAGRPRPSRSDGTFSLATPRPTRSSSVPVPPNLNDRSRAGHWHLHIPWWWLERLFVPVLAVLVLLAILLIVRLVPQLERRRFRPAPASEPSYAPATPDRVLDEVGHTFSEALAAFRRGDRERAIIACWIRLEQLAEEAGQGRRSSETSSELVARWLRQLPLDPAPLGRLAELYREARYSSHPVPDASIEAARSALEQLRRQLTSPVSGDVR